MLTEGGIWHSRTALDVEEEVSADGHERPEFSMAEGMEAEIPG